MYLLFFVFRLFYCLSLPLPPPHSLLLVTSFSSSQLLESRDHKALVLRAFGPWFSKTHVLVGLSQKATLFENSVATENQAR